DVAAHAVQPLIVLDVGRFGHRDSRKQKARTRRAWGGQGLGVDAGGSVVIHAERMPAIQALEVVENGVIDEIAEGGTGRPAGNGTDYSAKQGTGQAPKGRSGRAG